MGHLRLLYCDSAGVRRCRVLVCDGETPRAGLTGCAVPSTQAAPAGQASLEVTPSIALAAAAGVLPSPIGAKALQPSKSLGRVSEDRVLSPEVSQEQLGLQQLQEEQQQQQQQQQQGSGQTSGTATPTLPKLGSFTTGSGMKPSPSMILAAAAGAITVPYGANISRFHSNSSLDELAGMGAVPDYYAQQQLQSQPSNPTANGVSTLSPSPSMALAAAVGAITMGPGSASSSRHQSPSRMAPSAAAGTMGSPLQQQQQQSVPLLSKLSPGRPRPLISAFLKSPLSITGGAVAPATVAVNYSIGLTKACMGQPAFADVVVESSGLAPVGEVLLVPDLAAAVPWVGQPGDIMAPADMVERDLSQPWSCCPRSALKRALSSLESRFGLTMMAGFELEFVLLKPANLELFRTFPEAAKGANVLLAAGQAWVPVDDAIYGQASAMSTSTMAVLRDVVSSLQEIGIGIVQYHPEAAPGQFEVAMSPFPALEAADKLLLAREVVTTVAGQHGLAVTWLPKPMAGQAGSGCHMHFSLRRNGESVMADAAAAVAGGATYLPPASYPLSSTANSFLCGVLDHLPALLPFTAPSTNSYDRLQPGTWSCAYVCWGYDNKEAPLRLCCPAGGPQGTNAEYKAFDGTTNPYIGLSAVVAAGILGLQEGSRLPSNLQLDPGTAYNAALAATMQKLPSSLTQALHAWEADDKLQGVMHDVLGSDLIKAFMAVRRCEVDANPTPQSLLLRY